MNFLELTRKRFSARSYKPDSISDEEIGYLIEAARMAPSAVNRQPWHFFIVKSEEYRKKVQECYPREWFKEAPLYIVVCVDESAAWVRGSDNKSHADIDAAIAAEHICLAAADSGLGSCWVCNFDAQMLHQLLNLPANLHAAVILPIGHIREYPEKKSERKEAKEITTEL